MKLTILTISPVHIGSGRVLEPFDYITREDSFVRLDEQKAFSLAMEHHPDFPERFSEWFDQMAEKIENEKRNEQLSKYRSALNIKSFCEQQLNDRKLAELISTECAKYTFALPYGLDGKHQVDELLKDTGYKPYIPGSSIKGAIRTALIANAVANAPNETRKEIIAKIEYALSKNKKGQDLDDKMIETLLHAGYKKKDTDEIFYIDLKYDLLKFITVTDALPLEYQAAVLPVNLYLLGEEPQKQANAVEVILPGSRFQFELNVDIIRFREILQHTNTKTHWVEAEKKFRQLLQLPESKPLKEFSKKELENAILNTAKNFFKKTIALDKSWYEKAREKRIADIHFWEKIPEDYKLLKIGKGSGFTATTVFTSFDLKNEKDKKFISTIFDHYSIGYQKAKKDEKNKTVAPDLKKFPKSRKLTAQRIDVPVAPLGWCLALPEGKNFDAKIFELPEKTDISFTASLSHTEKPKEVKLSKEEYREKNSSRKYEQGDTVEAVFIKAEGKNVFVELLDNRYTGQYFKFNYVSSHILSEIGMFRVKISEVKSGKITNISFGGFIDR